MFSNSEVIGDIRGPNFMSMIGMKATLIGVEEVSGDSSFNIFRRGGVGWGGRSGSLRPEGRSGD